MKNPARAGDCIILPILCLALICWFIFDGATSCSASHPTPTAVVTPEKAVEEVRGSLSLNPTSYYKKHLNAEPFTVFLYNGSSVKYMAIPGTIDRHISVVPVEDMLYKIPAKSSEAPLEPIHSFNPIQTLLNALVTSLFNEAVDKKVAANAPTILIKREQLPVLDIQE
jgi:hypothetical protein